LFDGPVSGRDAMAFHMKMMKEAQSDDEEDEEHENMPGAKAEPALSSKARLFGNPTPFPNEDLLEKLSNKLAKEEQESHRLSNTNGAGIKLSIGGGTVFQLDPADDVDQKKSKNSNKKKPAPIKKLPEIHVVDLS
jgi:hypothetical protein